MPYFGYVGRCTHAQETTFGTAVTGDASVPFISMDVRRVPRRMPIPRLRHGVNSLVQVTTFTASDHVEGMLEVEAFAEGMGRFYELAFRKDVSTTGSDPYDHVYMMGPAAGPTKPSMTLGKVFSSGAAEVADVYEGCVIPSWEFSSAINEPCRWRFNILGETSAGQGAAVAIGSAPISAATAFYFNNVTTQPTWNGTAVACTRRITISCDHNMPPRFGHGAVTPIQPFPTDRPRLRIALEIDWSETLFQAGLIANTVGDFSVVFTNGARIMTWNAESCYVDSATSAVDTPGILTQRIELIPQTDDTTEGLKMTMRNATASGVAG